MKNTMIKMTAIACIAGCGAMASADTVVMKYIGNTGLNFVNTPVDGRNQAGHLTFRTNGGTSFNTFCIETAEHTNSSNATFEIVDLKDAPSPGASYGEAKANAVIAIIAKAIDMGWIDMKLQATPDVGMNAETNADRMSAIQAAIWTVLRPSGSLTPFASNTGSGSAADNAEIDSNISLFFATAPAQSGSTFNIMKNRLRAAVNDGYQDQLYVVPLPTSALAGLGMLGGLVGVRSIRRRHA